MDGDIDTPMDGFGVLAFMNGNGGEALMLIGKVFFFGEFGILNLGLSFFVQHWNTKLIRIRLVVLRKYKNVQNFLSPFSTLLTDPSLILELFFLLGTAHCPSENLKFIKFQTSTNSKIEILQQASFSPSF